MPAVDIAAAVADLENGASLLDVASEYREQLIVEAGVAPDDVTAKTFQDEVADFMRSLARHLGERHAGERRIAHALREWVRHSDHYEAWDALLSGFDVDGREALLRRGRVMFPGPLTAHWTRS